METERRAPAAATTIPATLKVGRISVQPPFAGTSLVLRIDELRYEVDPYNAFLASPSDLLGYQIALWLGGSGQFKAVRAPASPLTGDYVLEGFVTELYGDARSPQAPQAVLSLQIYLRRAGAAGGIVFERAYAERVAIDDAAPETLVRGYGVALSRILGALEHDLDALKPGRLARHGEPLRTRHTRHGSDCGSLPTAESTCAPYTAMRRRPASPGVT
ncbi:MAG: hypothetical protein HC807_01940 [Gammaproteobacteria bacterium]|nr:hypothetical protein [Gammaproteobacteria bacterium]